MCIQFESGLILFHYDIWQKSQSDKPVGRHFPTIVEYRMFILIHFKLTPISKNYT